MPRKFSRIHLPRTTGRGSVRLRGDGQYAALSEQAAANVVLVERDPPEVSALDVWNPVVAREPFVQERVVRCEKLQSSSVFVHDRVEEEFCFTLERLAQVVVEIWKYDGDRSGARHVAEVQPLPAKFFTNASDRWSASIRSTCRSSPAGS